MAIQTKQQALNESIYLLQRLQENQAHIQESKPFEQLEIAASLTNDISLLTQLQHKVNATFLGIQGAIPEANEEDLLAISEKLCAASDIIETIQANNDIAFKILELTEEIQSVFANVNPGNISRHEAELLNRRIIDLTSSAQINNGNLTAGELLKNVILSYPQTAQQTDVDQPLISNATLIAEQDESFQVTLFQDQFSTLKATLDQVPQMDFEVVFKFYVVLRTTYSDKAHFITHQNKNKFECLLKETEGLVYTIIDKQKELDKQTAERNPATALQGLRVGDCPALSTRALEELQSALDIVCNEMKKPNSDVTSLEKTVQDCFSKISSDEREKLLKEVNIIRCEEKPSTRPIPLTLLGQPCKAWADYPILQKALMRMLSSQAALIAPPSKGSPALLKLREELESACNVIKVPGFDANSVLSKVREAFYKLSLEEKKKLFNALSDVLIIENQRRAPLPASLLNQQFNVWSGSYPYRLKAVEKLLESSKDPIAAPVVNKIAAEMLSRMNEVQARFAAKNQIPSQQSANLRHTNTPVGLTPPLNRSNPNAPVQPSFEEFDEEQFDTVTLRSIKTLQKVLNCIHANASHNDLQIALETLAIFESLGSISSFQITSKSPLPIAQRPCFHLYFIHKNETPNKLVNDMQYGSKAMAGVYPTSNEERTRAIQRTILELALEGLEDAINFSSIPDMKDMASILQEIVPLLDQRDALPLALVNLTQSQSMLEAWTSLCSSNYSNQSNQTLIETIGFARNMLKEAWNL